MSSQTNQAQVTNEEAGSGTSGPKNEIVRTNQDVDMADDGPMYSEPTGRDYSGGEAEFAENAMDVDGENSDGDDSDEDEDAEEIFLRKLIVFQGDISGFLEDQTTTVVVPPDILTHWGQGYKLVQKLWSHKRTKEDKKEMNKIDESIQNSNKKEGRTINRYMFPWSLLTISIEASAKSLKDIKGLSEQEREPKLKDLLNQYAFTSKQLLRDGVDLRQTLTPDLRKVLDQANKIHKSNLEQGDTRNLFIRLSSAHQEVLRDAQPYIQSFFSMFDDKEYSEGPKILQEIKKQTHRLNVLNRAPKQGFDSWSLPIRRFEELWKEWQALNHEALQATENKNDDPDAESADEVEEEIDRQAIPDGTKMIHPGWKTGITPYGKVRFVRFAGRGSYRVFLNAGTEQTPYFVVKNGSDFPRGCAETWFQEYKSESNHSKDWRPETFEALDIIQSEPSPWSTTNRAPPAYLYGLENNTPTIWTKSEAITRCGRKTTEMAIVQRLRKRAERETLLEQSRSRGVHPDTNAPLIESAKEETPWLLTNSFSLLTLEERPSRGARVTKLINSDAGEDISRKALTRQRRGLWGRDPEVMDMLANMQNMLEKFQALEKRLNKTAG